MPVINCLCGERIEAGDGPATVAALRVHADAAHRQWPITEEKARSFLATRGDNGVWSGERGAAGEVDVHPLTPDRAGDFLRFFDGDAFADNPVWASCYCYFYKFAGTGEAWQARGAAENRADQEASIRAGTTRGLLAYVDAKPVAWCHASPLALLRPLDNANSAGPDRERTGAIVCFVVAPGYRRQGIAGRLLDAASDMLRAQGCDAVQAYPVREGVQTNDARAYHGPLSMYLAAGFEQVRDDGDYVLVRKRLG